MEVKRFGRVGAVMGAGLFPLVSMAQTSAPGEAVFTSLSADAATYITAGFALLAVVLAGTVGMKLVKKILSRAT